MQTDSNIVRKKTKAELDIELTDAELLERGKELAEKVNNRRDVEGKLKIYVKDQQEIIKGLSADITRLTNAVNSGTEQQNVECELVVEIDSRKLWYECRGKVYNARELSYAEIERYRQTEIPDPQQQVIDGTQEVGQ